MAQSLDERQYDPVYRQLARLLDEIPNGFPPTASGVELRLLARLFTPEEAALALQLKLTLESVEQIARRTGEDPRRLENMLEEMAGRGLIREKRRPGKVSYSLVPFVVGIYEMQLDFMDEEMARLFEDYYQEAFHEMLSMRPPLQRIVPIEQNVPMEVDVMPYERVSQILGEGRSWGVMDCICRKQQRLIGHDCGHPMDVCMMVSKRPGTFDESDTIRALTKDEALAVVKRAEEAGLVHTVGNTQRDIFYICNCCTCSCAILRGVSQYGLLSAVSPSDFRAGVDADLCTGCELCIEACPFGALSMADGLCAVDGQRCFGCGLCASACPDEALKLGPRPETGGKPPPRSMPDWLVERAVARNMDLAQLEAIVGKLGRKRAN